MHSFLSGLRQSRRRTADCKSNSAGKIHPASTSAVLSLRFCAKHAGCKRTVKLNPSEKSISPAPTHSPLAFLRQTRRMQADDKIKSIWKKSTPSAPMHSPSPICTKHAGCRRTIKLAPPEKSIPPVPTHSPHRFAHAHRMQADGKTKLNPLEKSIRPHQRIPLLPIRTNKSEAGGR